MDQNAYLPSVAEVDLPINEHQLEWSESEDSLAALFAGHLMRLSKNKEGYLLTYLGYQSTEHFKNIEEAKKISVPFAMATLFGMFKNIQVHAGMKGLERNSAVENLMKSGFFDNQATNNEV